MLQTRLMMVRVMVMVMVMVMMMAIVLRELRELDYSDFKASSPCSCVRFELCEVLWFLKY